MIATFEVEFKVGTDGELLQTHEGRKGEGYGSNWADTSAAHLELVVISDCQKLVITFNIWFAQNDSHPVRISRLRFTKVLEQLERRL